jgi:hypothetical protein
VSALFKREFWNRLSITGDEKGVPEGTPIVEGQEG